MADGEITKKGAASTGAALTALTNSPRNDDLYYG
jgi:hypothetical protein